MKAVRASVVVGDGRLPGVDVLVGVMVLTWVLEPVNDVIVERILVVWDAVNRWLEGWLISWRPTTTNSSWVMSLPITGVGHKEQSHPWSTMP